MYLIHIHIRFPDEAAALLLLLLLYGRAQNSFVTVLKDENAASNSFGHRLRKKKRRSFAIFIFLDVKIFNAIACRIVTVKSSRESARRSQNCKLSLFFVGFTPAINFYFYWRCNFQFRCSYRNVDIKMHNKKQNIFLDTEKQM